MAIADVFDALTSDRVYRPAMTLEQALTVLRDRRGTHFDPVLLDHFLNDLNDYEAGPSLTLVGVTWSTTFENGDRDMSDAAKTTPEEARR